MIPYSYIELRQHWLNQWPIAWLHQTITWIYVDLSSMEFYGINLRPI